MICKCCKIKKEFDDFYKNASYKAGYESTCKKCRSIQFEERYEKNKDYYKKRSDSYRKENKDKVKNALKNYYNKNVDKVKEYQKEYREKNKEKGKEYNKKYRKENKEILSEKKKVYLEENKEKYKEYFHNYNKKNFSKRKNQRESRREILKKYNYTYKKNRNENDELFRISNYIRSSILSSFKRSAYRKSSRTHEILGCSFEEFKSYLENKLEHWMTWDNRGKYNGELNYGWDLDHIIPISSAKTEEDVIKLNHYTNFQPLCSYVNRYLKRDKLDEIYKLKYNK